MKTPFASAIFPPDPDVTHTIRQVEVPGSEARFYRSFRLITHALEAYAPRRPWTPILFMAGWPLDYSLVSVTHAGLLDQVRAETR